MTTPITLATSPMAIVLGAQLGNSLTSNLPSSIADSHLRDQDNDDNPGVSIQIPGYGSIYAALRVKLSLAATLPTTAAFGGDATISLDQKIYGDSIWFYDAAASADETAQHVHVKSADNGFRMKSNASSCAQVRAAFPQ